MTIQRFILKASPVQIVQMPKNAEILSAQAGGKEGFIILHALVNESLGNVGRRIKFKITGEEADDIQDHDEFIGTVAFPLGTMHLFDSGEVESEENR